MNKSESKYFNTAIRMDKALIELLDEKDYQYITVKEICNRAEVNRSTFYLHYESINDLLAECIEYIKNSFQSKYNQTTNNLIANIDNCDLSELVFITPKYLYPYLSFIKENRRVFSVTISQANVMQSDKTFEQMTCLIFKPIMRRFFVDEENIDYTLSFYIHGIISIISLWIKNNFDKEIEDIAEIIVNCIINPQKTDE
ncbi:MAG: TetR/AcrR family transcriptional regulator [Eubacterium sp.]